MNCIGNENKCKFVTLTYNNAVSEKKLQNDLHNFHTAINSVIGHHEYIDFMQLGNAHSCHCHSILIFNNEVKSNKTIGEQWKNKGTVDVQDIENFEGIIKYLTSLNGSDCNLDKSISEKVNIWNYDPNNYLEYTLDIQKQIKSYVRNQRIHYYPPYFRTVRYSKNIKHEKIDYYTDEGLVCLLGEKSPNFEKSIKVKGTGIINTYRHYNFDR